MKHMPKIGARVQFADERHPERTCAGTVVKQYPGDDTSFDHAAVRVDAPLPGWWAYPDTDVFAPEIGELTPITE